MHRAIFDTKNPHGDLILYDYAFLPSPFVKPITPHIHTRIRQNTLQYQHRHRYAETRVSRIPPLEVEARADLLHLGLPLPLQSILSFAASAADTLVHSAELESESFSNESAIVVRSIEMLVFHSRMTYWVQSPANQRGYPAYPPFPCPPQ